MPSNLRDRSPNSKPQDDKVYKVVKIRVNAWDFLNGKRYSFGFCAQLRNERKLIIILYFGYSEKIQKTGDTFLLPIVMLYKIVELK